MDHQQASMSSGYSGTHVDSDESKSKRQNQRRGDGNQQSIDNHPHRYNENDPGNQEQGNHTKNAGTQTGNERRNSSRQSPDDFPSSSVSTETSRLYFKFIKPPKKIVDFEGCRITVGVEFTTNVPVPYLQADWSFHRTRIRRQTNFKISSDGYCVRHEISIILDHSVSGSSQCRIRIIDSQKNVRGSYVIRSRCIVLERQVIPGLQRSVALCRAGLARSAIDIRPNCVPKQNIGSQNPVKRENIRPRPPPPPQSNQSANGYNRGPSNGLASFLAPYQRYGTTDGNLPNRASTNPGPSSSGPVFQKCRPRRYGSSPYQPHEEEQLENEQDLLREVIIIVEDNNQTSSHNSNSSSNSSGWRRFRPLTRLYYTIEGLLYWLVCQGHGLYYSTLYVWYLIVREYNRVSEGIRQMNRENR